MDKHEYIKIIRELKMGLNHLENQIEHEIDWNTELALIQEENNNYESKKTFENLLKEVNSKVDSSTKSTTLLIDKDTYEKFEDLSSRLEVVTAHHSRYNPDLLNKEELNNFKEITKSFKSRFVTIAINLALNKWEKEHDIIPKMNKVRYKNKDKDEYYRSFMWSENNQTFGVTLDNRSNEIELLTTKDILPTYEKTRFRGMRNKEKLGKSKEYIEKWFEEKKQLAESQKKSK